MNEQNTAEIDGTKYTVTKDGENLILSPVKEPRKAKEGDVLIGLHEPRIVLRKNAYWFAGGDGPEESEFPPMQPEESIAFNIFDVINGDYVKKQDVIDALSIEDSAGYSVLGFIFGGPDVYNEGRNVAEVALTALGISPKE